MGTRYTRRVDERFLDDLKEIRHKKLVDPKHWGLFKSQLTKEWDLLDEKWEEISRKTDYPPLSTYGYRKRYMHSIPSRFKLKYNWEDKKSDFRIIFKVDEVKKEIYYFGIGKRIKGLPKDPSDIWELIKGRTLPEE